MTFPRSLLVFGILFPLTALPSHAVKLNTSAPSFKLENSQKEVRRLSDYKGQIVLVNFWASWCAPCQMELPELARLASDYKGKKFRVLAINVDSDRAAARALLSTLKLSHSSMEILWDTQSRVVSAYNIPAMPSSYLIDPQGRIRYIHAGYQPSDTAAWRKEINELRGGRLRE